MSLPPLNMRTVLRAIRHSQVAGYVRHSPTRTLCEPREVWFPGASIWVRVDGSNVSGAIRGRFRPGFWDRLRIRRAFRQRTKPIAGVL